MTEPSSLYIYRASSLGSCDKALIAARIGYEADESVYKRMSTIFDEGNLHEDAVVAKYRETNNEIVLQQHEVNLKIMDGVIVQGHLDGVIHRGNWPGPLGRVLEIKSMGDGPFKEFKKHGMDTPGLIQKYKWQISAYMLAMERPALLVCKSRNTGEIIETLIDTPYYSYQDIKTRIVRLEAQARTGELPVKCSNPQFPCPFFYLHEEDEPELILDTAIDAFVKVYKEAKSEEERAKAKGKLARERLLGLSHGNKVETPHSRITFYTTKTKKVDWNRILEDHGIEKSDYETTKESDPIMRVTAKSPDTKAKGEETDGKEPLQSSGTNEPLGQTELFGASD